MSEDKRKNEVPVTRSSLTPEQASSFTYHTEATVEEVRQALTNLQLKTGFIKHEVAFTPTPDGYQFRYNIARWGGRGAGITASAEGQLWRNYNQTLIEGTIGVSTKETSLFLLTAICIVIFPLLILLFAILLGIATERADAHRIKQNIAEAERTHSLHKSKQ